MSAADAAAATPSPHNSLVFELHGGNYADWRFRMQMVLVRLNLWDVVSGAVPRPGDDDPLRNTTAAH